MSEDEGSGRTRRRLLSGIAGVAGLGFLGGAGTRAVLQDTQVIPGRLIGNPYTGGRLRLDTTCGAPPCSVENDAVTFEFTDIEPPATGTTTLCLRVTGPAAWLWVRTSGSTTTALGDYLELTLSYEDGTLVEVDGAPVSGWPLTDVLDALGDGVLFDGTGPEGAVSAGTERCLTIDWSLPDSTAVRGDSATISFTFVAIQYRADAAASNPWTNGTQQ